jgi:CheY-like chemotaxis protein
MDRRHHRERSPVLVIDSDRSGAETLKNLLVEGGFQVYTAGTFEEALTVVKEKKVAVALWVLGRPDFDPESLIKSLQQGKDDGMIPVIVILESFSEELVAAAIRAGAADYLTRPLDAQELTRRTGVHARLEEYRGGDNETDTPVLRKTEPPSSRKGFISRLLNGLPGLITSRFNTDELLGQRYEKIARLGIGSFGEVWKVRDAAAVNPAIFVAKIPLSKKLNAKIEKEARILERLAGHAIVPEVCEVIEEKSKKVLIMEFVEGKTLFEVIERELEEKEVESVMIQLMDGVAYAHDMGIIHRDIKPENVMVRPDGTIKLLDFGAAKELKEREMSDTVTGSRPYMSPEQIMGKSQRRSDVWALGVVMYVLYTGMFPFYHDVEKVLMDMILELPPPLPSKSNEDIDPEIEKVILRCLEKNLKNRYPNAGALQDVIIALFPDYGENILLLY